MEETELMIEDCPPMPGEEPGPEDVVIPIPMKEILRRKHTMDEKLTIAQVLEITGGLLEGIEVPMKQMEKIGQPVMNAIHNLQMCIQASAMAETQAREQAEAPEEPEAEEEENGNADAE